MLCNVLALIDSHVKNLIVEFIFSTTFDSQFLWNDSDS